MAHTNHIGEMTAQAAGASPDLSSGATSGSAKRSLSPIPRAAKSCCNRLVGLLSLGYGAPIVPEAVLTTAIPVMPIVIVVAV